MARRHSPKARETTIFQTERSCEDGLGSLMFLRSILRQVRRWEQRVKDRRHLSGLSDHALSDWGLSRSDVTREAAKPFWQPLDPRRPMI